MIAVGNFWPALRRVGACHGEFWRFRLSDSLIGQAQRMQIRLIGHVFLAVLWIAMLVAVPANLAVAGDASEYASVLQTIFSRLQANGFDMKFSGPIAATLGVAQEGQNAIVRELPPVRSDSTGIIHVFFQLKDGTGYIVVRFSTTKMIALRFNQNFDLIAAAVQSFGRPAALLSGTPVQKVLTRELREWSAIARRISAGR